MRVIMNLLASLAGLYSLLIFIRVILTWFGRADYGKPVKLLTSITDPYLSWWQRFPVLRLGFLDLSPIAAMASLSVIQTVFSTFANYGRISLGIIFAICLSAIWSAASFILGFCFFILILRFIAYMTSRDITGNFWLIIDTISRPLLFRIQRLIFGNRLINYLTGILVSIAALFIVWLGGGFVIKLIIGMLIKSPL